ncbi:MAG: acyltransferase [Melioribacteraceae bacterium]|nr:acyltransferase [Melioribacteraceae bacterium]
MLLIKIYRLLISNISIKFSSLITELILFINGCPLPSKITVDGIVFIKIANKGSIKIGNGFILNSRKSSNLVGINNRASFQTIDKGRIEIGDNCGFTSTVLSSRSLIRIGSNVKIGGNVRIFDHDYHSLNHLNRRDTFLDRRDVKTSPVIIEDDVFIGTNSIILKGVSIGARSIIGAGSVVSLKNIPPDSTVVGNPAKIVKTANLK